MARLIRAKVAEGRYASNSEVIREAMRARREQEQPAPPRKAPPSAFEALALESEPIDPIS